MNVPGTGPGVNLLIDAWWGVVAAPVVCEDGVVAEVCVLIAG